MPNFVPITCEKHSEIKIKPLEGLAEFTNVSLLPIYDMEIPRLAVSFPLVVVPEGEGYTLSLLCSLSDDMSNAWINNEGRWVGGYLPAIIRQRPFSCVKTEEDKLLVCIDEDSPLIGDEGTPLFENESPTEYLNKMKEFIPVLYNSGQRTGRVMKLLHDLDLITCWEIELSNQSETSGKIEGLFHFDEEKLQQLDDEDWLSLRDQGAMPLIYGQLFSMVNLQTLAANLQAKINYAQSSIISQEDSDFVLKGDDETLSFDKL